MLQPQYEPQPQREHLKYVLDEPGVLVNKLGSRSQLFSPQVQKVLNSVTKEVPEKDREWLEKTLRELNLE